MLILFALLGAVSLPSTWCMFRANPQRTGRITGTGNITNGAAWTTDTVRIGNGWGAVIGSALLYDYSGDGRLDVTITQDNTPGYDSCVYIYRIVPGSPAQKLVSRRDTYDIRAGGALMDVNGDGKPEIFVASYQRGFIECINGATGDMLWRTSVSGTRRFYEEHSLLALPYPSDSGRIAAIDERGVMYILNATSGRLIAKDSLPNISHSYGAPAAGDVTGDGIPEILFPVYGRLSGIVMVNPVNGAVIAKDSIGYYCDTYTPGLDNFDADAALEVVVFYRRETSPYPSQVSLRNWTGSGFSRVWTYDGSAWGGQPGSFIRQYSATGIGDLNKDGTPDVVYVWADTLVITINGMTGSLMWQDKIRRVADRFRAAPSLADIDGDSYLEIIITGGNCQGEGMVYFWEHDVQNGKRLKGIWDVVDAQSTAELCFDIEASFGDTDLDGRLEVVSITPDPNLMVIDAAATWQREPSCGEPLYDEVAETDEGLGPRVWFSGGRLFAESGVPVQAEIRLYDPPGRLLQEAFRGTLEGRVCLTPREKGLIFAVMEWPYGRKVAKGIVE